MRYSVVLPRADPRDGEETRRALERASILWEKGEVREAIEHVRDAAAAATAAGWRGRALALTKAATSLARGIGAPKSTVPPAPPRREHVEESPERVEESPEPGALPPLVLSLPPPNAEAFPPPTQSASAVERVTMPAKRVPASADPAPALRTGENLQAPTLPPSADPAGSPAEAPESAELVVTVAPSYWELPSHTALIGHSARRVAIAPGLGPGGTLMVRPLAAGEVAPRGSVVAVLVALEPLTLPSS